MRSFRSPVLRLLIGDKVKRSTICTLGALLAVLSLGNGAATRAASEPTALLDQLIMAETGCESLCPGADSGALLESQIADLARKIRGPVEAALHAGDRVTALNRFVFNDLGIRSSQDLKNRDNLLLAQVLKHKQGYCVGIASLYLVLAERVGLPIYAVATPSHVFLRYDDGTTRINIETLQNGANIADGQYIRDERIPEASILKGVFMHNLTADEFIAQIHNNLGVIYSERKNYALAADQYTRALGLAPRFPTAYYNNANDLLAQSDYRRAARLFSKSLRLYPTDVWALNNRGLAYVKMGKLKKARRDFEEALKTNPGFEAARKNLEELPVSPESP